MAAPQIQHREHLDRVGEPLDLGLAESLPLARERPTICTPHTRGLAWIPAAHAACFSPDHRPFDFATAGSTFIDKLARFILYGGF